MSLFMLFSLFFINIEIFSFKINDDIFYVKEKNIEISWIHSVEKEEWKEDYTIKDGRILLTETYFKTFGAGVPSNAGEVKIEDGFVNMQINQYKEEINLVVSSNVKTKLNLKNKVVNLYKLTEDYELIEIKAEKINLWQYLRGDFL